MSISGGFQLCCGVRNVFWLTKTSPNSLECRNVRWILVAILWWRVQRKLFWYKNSLARIVSLWKLMAWRESSRHHAHRTSSPPSQLGLIITTFQTNYRSTHGGLKSKTYVATKKGRIYLRHNSIHEDVPIVIALKALGVQSDKEILLLTAGNTAAYKIAFSANLEDAAKLGVFTRQQALEYIGTRVKVNRRVVGPRRPAWEEALEALATIVLAHVPVSGLDLRPKAIFVATMTRRVLMAMNDGNMVDDRDYVGNKRLELWVGFSSPWNKCSLVQILTDGYLSLVPDSYWHCSLRIYSRLIIQTWRAL